MPSKSGAELDYLIEERGFPQSRVICIDDNPAIIASAKWRKKYKSVRAYGISVGNVGKKLQKLGVELSYANLDMCNNFSDSLVSEIKSFLRDCPKTPCFNFAVTVSKGREQSVTNYLMNIIVGETPFLSSGYESIKEKRIACLMRLVWPDHKRLNILKQTGFDSYINNKTPMAWSAFRIENIERHPLMAKAVDEAKFQRHLAKRGALGIKAVKDLFYENTRHLRLKTRERVQDLEKIEKHELEKLIVDESGVGGLNDFKDLLSDDYIKDAYVLAKLLHESYEKTEKLIHCIKDGAIDPAWHFRWCPISEKLISESGLNVDDFSDVETALKIYKFISVLS